MLDKLPSYCAFPSGHNVLGLCPTAMSEHNNTVAARALATELLVLYEGVRRPLPEMPAYLRKLEEG